MDNTPRNATRSGSEDSSAPPINLRWVGQAVPHAPPNIRMPLYRGGAARTPRPAVAGSRAGSWQWGCSWVFSLGLGLMMLLGGRAADAATVDPNFNAGPFGASVRSVVVQDDGKVLVVGDFADFGPNRHWGITRLNRDGSPDVSFNAGGTEIRGANSYVLDCIKGPDGNYLLGGQFSAYNGIACKGLVRISPQGALLNTFPGILDSFGTPNYGHFAALRGLAALPNNGVRCIVSAPFGINGTSWLTEFAADGTGGPAFPNLFGELRSDKYYPAFETLTQRYPDWYTIFTFPMLVEATSGKTILRLRVSSGSYLVRLNTDGTVDNSYSTPAFVDVAKLMNHTGGKVLVQTGADLLRLDGSGRVDTSFNAPDGVGNADFAILPDNSIVTIGGSAYNNIVRLNENGSLDPSFRVSGLPGVVIGNFSVAPDGAIYLFDNNRGDYLYRLIADFAPIIVQGPQSAVVNSGSSTHPHLATVVSGTEPLSYQWSFNNVPIPEATNASLALTMDATRVGAYSVAVSNLVGSTSSPPAYLVLPGKPTLFHSPQSRTVTNGATVAFAVTAFGAGTLGYQWQHSGTNLPGATNATLSLTNVSVAQAGTYSVSVGNASGTTNSAPATLTVMVPPQITVPPPASVTNFAGSTAQFGVTATGTAPLAYRWFFGSASILNATNANLSLTNVQAAQAGNYRVVITNIAGAVTSSVVSLTVLVQPPSLLAQPTGESFNLGSGYTLSVSAGGSAPLAYQWQFNGTNITGATGATLALSNLAITNAGAYRVVITNSAGSVTSSVANLLFFGDLKLLASTVLAGPIGQQFRVDYADVITPATNWLVLTNITLPYSPYVVVDYTSAGKPKRFYRAVPVP